MGYRSDADCNISITGGDPDNHADNRARLKAIITDTLDGDDFHYPPEGLRVVEDYSGVIDVYFEYTDSTIYELPQALLATLRNLVDDGWTIIDVDVKRIGNDSWAENPDIEIWTVLDGHVLASNYDGAIGSIRRHEDTWADTADTAIVTETKLSAMVADTIAAHIGATSADDRRVQTKIAALTSLGAFTTLPQAMTQAELADIIARLLD